LPEGVIDRTELPYLKPRSGAVPDLLPTIPIPIPYTSYILPVTGLFDLVGGDKISVAMFRAQQNAFDDAVGKSLELEVELLRSSPELSCDGARGTQEMFGCGCLLTMRLSV
jgi:hypothetical protein